jgi:MoaA/NifB/PqqE/SkfB family radical SAM enzyme
MWQRGSIEKEMDLDGWKKATDDCIEMGVRWIELFGGDALLRKDILVPLVKHIKTYPDINCNMPTNCNLMDRETAEGLVEAGMDDIWISMDGIDITHDKVRGREGTFDRANRAIDWLLAARGGNCTPNIRVNVTISRYNASSFDKVLAFAERKGMDAVHLEYVGEFWQQTIDKADIEGIRPTPYYIRQGNESSLVNREQAFLIKRKVEMMKKQAETMRVRLFSENIDKLTIENMVKGRFDNKRCYITRFKVSIDPSGSIIGCPFYGKWAMGNIREQNLRKIWRNQRHKKFMKAFIEGRFQFCNYCILGVQRNPTLFQDIRDQLNAFFGRVRM